MAKVDSADQLWTPLLSVLPKINLFARSSRAEEICQPMVKTSAPPRPPRWWHFWKLCTRRIRNQHAMLLKPWCLAKARRRHGRPGYVRAQCPDSVVAISSRDHIDSGGHCVGLSARLARSSKCLPKAHRRLAAGGVHEWPRLSGDCCRVSTRHTRSSVTYDSHGEAPSADDHRCSADSGGGTRLSPCVRTSETLH